jgi:hypothetical protein
MVAAIAGNVAPAPMPEQARAATMSRSELSGETVDMPTIEVTMARVPNVAARLSPMRSVK